MEFELKLLLSPLPIRRLLKSSSVVGTAPTADLWGRVVVGMLTEAPGERGNTDDAGEILALTPTGVKGMIFHPGGTCIP